MKISDISTKIIATVGPSSSNRLILSGMIEKGVNVFRLNFSHGTHAEHAEIIKIIRELAQEMGKEIGILQDICGPKIRIGEVQDKVLVKEGDELFFTKKDIVLTQENKVSSMSYPQILDTLNIGDIFYIADGKVRVQVVQTGDPLKTKVQAAGVLSSRKGLNFPNINLPVPILTPKDRADIAFGIEMKVDWIAISFVSHAQDIKEAQKLVKESNIPLIAKIEKPQAIKNLEEIVDIADGVMVARGDLGVEVGFELVPVIQKQIIQAARHKGIPVIIATQMLLSMVQSPIATRAEISDVAGAVYDGVDAIMLSDETTVGNYPQEAVETLYKTARMVADHLPLWTEQKPMHPIRYEYEAIAQSAVELANNLQAKAIVAFSETGRSVQALSKYRPESPIWLVSPQKQTLGKSSLYWGVQKAMYFPILRTIDQKLEYFLKIMVDRDLIQKEDTYVITIGYSQGIRPINTIYVLSSSEIQILREHYNI